MSSRARFVALLAVLAVTSTAKADNHIALSRFHAAPAGDSFFGVAAPPADIQDLGLRTRLTLDWAHDPLVLINPANGNEVNEVVKDQVIANVGIALDFKKRFTFSLDVPFAIAQGSGEVNYAIRRAGGAHIGDTRIGARARLVSFSELFKLSAAAYAFLPLGKNESSSGGTYMSDGNVRGIVELIAHGDNGRYVWSAAVGPEIRDSQSFFGVRQGTSLHIAAGVGARFWDNRLQVGPESRAIITLDNGTRYNRNWEALVGVRYHKPLGLNGGVAFGPGFTNGVGTPDFRVVANIGYDFSFDKKAPPPAPAPADTDKDGVDDAHDGCPDVAGPIDNNGCPLPPPAPVPAPVVVAPPPPDRDNDGVVDARDACVEIPGPADNDGCPVSAPPPPAPAPEPAAKVVGNEIVILQQIQFETGSDVIKGESVPTMEAILAAVNSLPADARFLVEGFTDSKGSVKNNERLSLKRAKSVAKWLGQHGVASTRFTTAGLGPSRPIQSNDTEEGRKANRRVEIHIVK